MLERLLASGMLISIPKSYREPTPKSGSKITGYVPSILSLAGLSSDQCLRYSFGMLSLQMGHLLMETVSPRKGWRAILIS
jgi:hypothetical protein